MIESVEKSITSELNLYIFDSIVLHISILWIHILQVSAEHSLIRQVLSNPPSTNGQERMWRHFTARCGVGLRMGGSQWVGKWRSCRGLLNETKWWKWLYATYTPLESSNARRHPAFLSACIGPLLRYSFIKSKQIRVNERHLISKWHERRRSIHEILFLKLRQALIYYWSQINEIVILLLRLTWRSDAHTHSHEEDSIRYVANFINIIKRITFAINDAFLPSSCHFFPLRSFVRSKQVREQMKGM